MKTLFRCLNRAIVLVMLAGLIGSHFQAMPVQAQDPTTTLSVVSPVTDICNGSELTLVVRVANVVDLYAYDVSLTFDPSVLEVLEFSNTGWLPSATKIYTLIDNNTGFVRLAMTKTSPPGTGISGSGDLINIKVKVLKPATNLQFQFFTSGDFPTELVNSSVNSIPYTVSTSIIPYTHACLLYFAENSRIGCSDTTIPLWVEDVTNLYAYRLNISYDKNVVQVLDAVPDSSFLSPDFAIIDLSTPGLIDVNVSQFNPAPPKNGTGILINVKAKTIVPNQDSKMTITTQSLLSDRNGNIIKSTIINRHIHTYPCEPNAVNLLSFKAQRKPDRVVLTWQTATEQNNVGFYLYRSKTETGKRIKLNGGDMIAAKNDAPSYGATYKFKDFLINPLRRYYYWLEAVDTEGKTETLKMIVSKPLTP